MDWFWQALVLLFIAVPLILLFAYAAFDVMRRPDLRLVLRVLWFIAFCVLPILGPLVYLGLRPPGTTAQERRGGTVSQAQELATLADLHDRGKLSDSEYQQAKSQQVGVDLDALYTGSAQERGTGPLAGPLV